MFLLWFFRDISTKCGVSKNLSGIRYSYFSSVNCATCIVQRTSIIILHYIGKLFIGLPFVLGFFQLKKSYSII